MQKIKQALSEKFVGEKTAFSAATEYLKEVILPALFYCTIAGIMTGLLISAYGYCAGWLFENSAKIYAFVRENLAYTPLLFLGLLVISFLSALLVTKVPEVKGSGIPRTEGILRGLLTFKWLRIIIGTIVGSFLSFFGGLSLGNEGPSVQLGAASAEGAGAILKSKFSWRRYISTGGAAAGMAIAFGAPITGITFAVEEVQKQFNPLLLFSTVVTTLSAVLTAKLLDPFIDYPEYFFYFVDAVKEVPFSSGWMLALVAIICGLCAALFNLLLIVKPIIKDGKYSNYIRIAAAFMLSGAAGLIWADSLGNGFNLIEKVATMSLGCKAIAVYLVIKLVLITIGYKSGATGGLFLPMLTLGALLGGLLAKMCLALGLPEEYYMTIVMICICAFLGATIRAPFTAFVLLLETTHSISGFTSAAVAIFIANIVAEVCMRKPLYDKLLENEVAAFNRDKPLRFCTFNVHVEEDCFAEHKYVRNVLWPSNCRITSITRDGVAVVPNGKTMIEKDDLLHISGDCYNPQETRKQLDSLLTNTRRRKKGAKPVKSGQENNSVDIKPDENVKPGVDIKTNEENPDTEIKSNDRADKFGVTENNSNAENLDTAGINPNGEDQSNKSDN